MRDRARTKCISLVLAAALTFISCSREQDSSTTAVVTAAAAAVTPSGGTSAAPEPRFLDVSGPIVVENQLDVVAQREGMVSSLAVDTGSMVKKGQLLATLDDRELKATRDAAEAKFLSIEADVKNWEAETRVAEVDFERAQKMMASDLITREQLDHTQYKLVASHFEVDRERQNAKNARETLKALELELEKTRILSPFDGVVARRYVRVAQKVNPGDRTFWVTATAPLRVKFALPEHFLGAIKQGQNLTVNAAALPNESFHARVIQISPVVDPSSATIEVLAELQPPSGQLRPGMTATVRIPEGR